MKKENEFLIYFGIAIATIGLIKLLIENGIDDFAFLSFIVLSIFVLTIVCMKFLVPSETMKEVNEYFKQKKFAEDAKDGKK